MADVNLAPSREVDFHPRLDVREIAVIILVPIMHVRTYPFGQCREPKGIQSVIFLSPEEI
jgi:hypothetical protein